MHDSVITTYMYGDTIMTHMHDSAHNEEEQNGTHLESQHPGDRGREIFKSSNWSEIPGQSIKTT